MRTFSTGRLKGGSLFFPSATSAGSGPASFRLKGESTVSFNSSRAFRLKAFRSLTGTKQLPLISTASSRKKKSLSPVFSICLRTCSSPSGLFAAVCAAAPFVSRDISPNLVQRTVSSFSVTVIFPETGTGSGLKYFSSIVRRFSSARLMRVCLPAGLIISFPLWRLKYPSVKSPRLKSSNRSCRSSFRTRYGPPASS